MHDELVSNIIELYPQYYQQITGNKKYKFKVTEKKLEQIEKFVSYMEEKVGSGSLGISFVKNFLSYAFAACKDKVNPWGGEKSYPLQWIVAKNVLNRFLKEKGYIVSAKVRSVSKLGNNKVTIKTSSEIDEEKENRKIQFTSVHQHEELEKRRFYNTEKGRVWCIDFTTLYNPKSEYCCDCKFKTGCRQMTKETFGKLLELREKNG